MQKDDFKKTNRKPKFGEPTAQTLKGHYTPLSEFDQKIIELVEVNFKTFTEANQSEIEKLNRVNLGLSYSKMAALLNDQGVKTTRGNKWTPAGLRRLLKKDKSAKKVKIGHGENNWEASRLTRKSISDEFAIKMDEEVLPLIDCSQKHHIIADQLNERGVKTRTGGTWGNVAVKRLFIRLKGLGRR